MKRLKLDLMLVASVIAIAGVILTMSLRGQPDENVVAEQYEAIYGSNLLLSPEASKAVTGVKTIGHRATLSRRVDSRREK